MPTNFKIQESKRSATPTGHYEPRKQHEEEMRRIEKLEKELKKHESQGLDKAHRG